MPEVKQFETMRLDQRESLRNPGLERHIHLDPTATRASYLLGSIWTPL